MQSYESTHEWSDANLCMEECIKKSKSDPYYRVPIYKEALHATAVQSLSLILSNE